MGYRLNGLYELVFMAGTKPMRTEFGILHRLESCVYLSPFDRCLKTVVILVIVGASPSSNFLGRRFSSSMSSTVR